MLLAVPLTAAVFGVISELRARYTADAPPGPADTTPQPSAK